MPAHERLAPCPSTPNCISTLADPDDHEHYEPPIAVDADPAAVMAAVVDALGQLERTTIVERTDDYLHAVVTSRWLRFKDDLELAVDPDARLLHVRSASRVGRSDLGVNRKRVRQLRDRIEARLAA